VNDAYTRYANAIARILRAMFGPAPLPEKSIEEARWEDDGGALTVRREGYDHVIWGGEMTPPLACAHTRAALRPLGIRLRAVAVSYLRLPHIGSSGRCTRDGVRVVAFGATA